MKNISLRSLADLGIEVREATEADFPQLEAYMSRPEIDTLFTPPLSDPARGITIRERVRRKSEQGVWIIAIHEDRVVGCLALVPTTVPSEVLIANAAAGIKVSAGVPFTDWGVDKIVELSTVVTDKTLRDMGVKGLGAALWNQGVRWVHEHGNGNWGFVTDSWVGGDMGGFVAAMNSKSYAIWLKAHGHELDHVPDTLLRIFTDPKKRGVNGPPTVVYGIPVEDRDWKFFLRHQSQISDLRYLYDKLEKQYN